MGANARTLTDSIKSVDKISIEVSEKKIEKYSIDATVVNVSERAVAAPKVWDINSVE